MAQELELEWWRPQAVQASPLDDAPTGTDQAALPFWSVMAFTAVLLFSPQTYVPALAPFRPALLVILIGVLCLCLGPMGARASDRRMEP